IHSIVPCSKSVIPFLSSCVPSFLIKSSPRSDNPVLDFLINFSFLLVGVRFCVKPSLTGIILEELADFLEKRRAPAYRAKQITDWIYKKPVGSFEAMTDLPNELRAELAAEFDAPKTEVVRVLGSKDTT